LARRLWLLLRVENVYKRLGVYDTPVEAAQAYDKAARFHFGKFAHTNFVGEERTPAEKVYEVNRRGRKEKGHSRYIGVSRDRLTWRAWVSVDRRMVSLGNYPTEVAAAKVRDMAVRYICGSAAKLNFSDGPAKSPDEIRLDYRKASQASHFRGVSRHKTLWLARMYVGNKTHYLGYYKSPEEAARAYDDGRAAQGLPRVNFSDQLQAA
jgi:hypothetical protein